MLWSNSTNFGKDQSTTFSQTQINVIYINTSQWHAYSAGSLNFNTPLQGVQRLISQLI